MRLPSMASTFTRIWSPSRSSSFTSFTRCSAISGDVQQAVGAGEDFDERAKLGDADDLAEIGLANLGRRGQVGDHLDGAAETVRIR